MKGVGETGRRGGARRLPPWREKGAEGVAAVDKIEDKRKPEGFIGHRNRMPTPTGNDKLCHSERSIDRCGVEESVLHLIRRGFAAPPSPQGEGLEAASSRALGMTGGRTAQDAGPYRGNGFLTGTGNDRGVCKILCCQVK